MEYRVLEIYQGYRDKYHGECGGVFSVHLLQRRCWLLPWKESSLTEKDSYGDRTWERREVPCPSKDFKTIRDDGSNIIRHRTTAFSVKAEAVQEVQKIQGHSFRYISRLSSAKRKPD